MKASWLEPDDVVIMSKTGNVYRVNNVDVIVENGKEYILVEYDTFTTTYNKDDELLVGRKGQVV